MIKKFFLWIQASKKNLFLAIVLPPMISFAIYLPLKAYDDRLKLLPKLVIDLDQGAAIPEKAVYVKLKGTLQYAPTGFYLVEEGEEGRDFSYYIPVTGQNWDEGEEPMTFFISRKIHQNKHQFTAEDPAPFLPASEFYEGLLVKKDLPKELVDYIRSKGLEVSSPAYVLESKDWSDRFIVIPAVTSLVCFFLLVYSYGEKRRHQEDRKRQEAVAYEHQTLEFLPTAFKKGLLIASLFFLLAPLASLIPYLAFAPASAIRDPGVLLLTISLPITIGLGLLALYYLRFGLERVEVIADQGLNITRRGRKRFVLWDEIVFFYSAVVRIRSHGFYTMTSESHTIELKNGEKFAFTSGLKDVYRLAKIIDTELLKRRYPEASERLERGGDVAFGPITLKPAGISKGGSELLEWKNVESVGVENGSVKVKAKGKMLSWFSKSCGKVPNVSILMRLASSKI